MAAKKPADLIPLCHRLNLTNCKVTFMMHPDRKAIEVCCLAACDGKTGVEMEALTAATVALLTIYDMCKAIDKRMEITDVHLVSKTGGKSGDFQYD